MMEFVSGFVIGICFTVGTIILLAGWAKRKNLEAKRRLEDALRDIKTRQYMDIRMDIERKQLDAIDRVEKAKARRSKEIDKAKNYESKVIPFRKKDETDQ
tara:strand:+ start:69 stop:368 length:300 start_codon:yes stop_codon:yes gene_type:complete